MWSWRSDICIHTSTQLTKTQSVKTSAKMALKNVASSSICLQVALDRVLYLLMLFLVTPEQTGSFVYGHSADAIWSRSIISRWWRVSESPSGCALPAYAHRCVPYGQRRGVTQAQSDILNNDGGFEYWVMQLDTILVPVFVVGSGFAGHKWTNSTNVGSTKNHWVRWPIDSVRLWSFSFITSANY